MKLLVYKLLWTKQDNFELMIILKINYSNNEIDILYRFTEFTDSRFLYSVEQAG